MGGRSTAPIVAFLCSRIVIAGLGCLLGLSCPGRGLACLSLEDSGRICSDLDIILASVLCG